MLIDEFENGFHYSVLPDVWRVIDNASKIFKTQIFASTHSREAIMAAHTHFYKQERYDFRFFRLQETNGKIKVVSYEKEILQAAFESDIEVR